MATGKNLSSGKIKGWKNRINTAIKTDLFKCLDDMITSTSTLVECTKTNDMKEDILSQTFIQLKLNLSNIRGLIKKNINKLNSEVEKYIEDSIKAEQEASSSSKTNLDVLNEISQKIEGIK